MKQPQIFTWPHCLIFTFAILLLGCGTPKYESQILETEYLSIEHPTDWSVATVNQLADTPGFEHVLGTYILAPQGSEGFSQFIISIESQDGDKTLSTYRQETQEILKKSFPDAKYKVYKKQDTNGNPSLSLSHKNETKAGLFEWKQTWIAKEGKIYTITLGAPVAEFKQWNKYAKSMLETLILKTEKSTPETTETESEEEEEASGEDMDEEASDEEIETEENATDTEENTEESPE